MSDLFGGSGSSTTSLNQLSPDYSSDFNNMQGVSNNYTNPAYSQFANQQIANPYQNFYSLLNSDAAQAAVNNSNSINNTGNSILSAANQAAPIYQQYLSNPYAQQAQNYANQAGSQSLATGTMDAANSGVLSNAGNQVLQTAMDPQGALYNQQQQQNTDQTNASLAARGLNSSALGAGLADQSNQNFNLGWQNNQLQRQESGINSAQGAFSGASGLGTSGVNATNNAGQLPYNQYTSNLGSQTGALGQEAALFGSAGSNAANLFANDSSQLYTAAAAPYNAYQNIYGNDINSLNSLSQADQNAQSFYGQDLNAASNMANTNLDIAKWNAQQQQQNQQGAGSIFGSLMGGGGGDSSGGLGSIMSMFGGGGGGSSGGLGSIMGFGGGGSSGSLGSLVDTSGGLPWASSGAASAGGISDAASVFGSLFGGVVAA